MPRTEETNQLSRLSFFGLFGCLAMIAAACGTTAKESGPTTTSTITAQSSTTTRPVSGTTSTEPTASSRGMPPPPGYTSRQLIFDDQFSGTRLDTTKWTTALGAQGIVWNDFGRLPAPYSGPNVPGDGTEAAMFGPSQVSVDNGLTLTAQRNTNQYAGTYPWISGVVTTEGKFSLPAGGWYVQVKAKMPDTSTGMWPAIWFMPDTATSPTVEIDGHEGGATGSGFPINDAGHSNYFANSGTVSSFWNAGADMSADYHIFGFEFIPGVSVKCYFDGVQVFQVLASSGVTITAGTYEIILQLQVAAQQISGSHTVTTGATPSATMDVAEVQAYSFPY
jgi:hypothetical protein